jgi:tetratricopeptide (TPR) repeat protein/TolB-like protein
MREVCAEIEAIQEYGSVVRSSARARRGRPSRRALAAAAALMCLCIGGDRPVRARYGPGGATLAVLPFQIKGASLADDYLSTGLADAIGARISSSSAIGVTPASVARQYGSDPRGFDTPRIGAELGVPFLMIGVITPTEDGYVITTTMKRTSDGADLWSDVRRVRRDELQTVEGDVADHVMTVRGAPPTTRMRSAHRDTQNAAAYDSYLRGRSALIRHDRAGTEEAIAHFQSAVNADSQWASAWAGLALALARQPWYESGERALELQRRAKDAATKAVELDPDSAHAHEALASVYRYDEFEWDKALAESARAIELQPSLDLAHFNMASAFYHTGLVDLSEAASLIGVSLNPVNRFECELNRGRAALYAGQYRAAVERLQPISKDSRPGATWMLAEAKFYLHEVAQSETLLRGLMKSDRLVVRLRAAASLAAFLAARRQRDQAEALITEVKSHDLPDHHVAYRLATAYAQLGRLDDAMFWLRRAANSGFPCETWFSRDELLAPLRDTPEYGPLAERLRTDAERRRARYARVVAMAAR